MLRLLGFVFLLILCVGTAPWGLVIGAILCVAWLFEAPAILSRFWNGRPSTEFAGTMGLKPGSVNAVPLVHAVYCANCDSITDSPHEACRCCGSHSILAVSRLWQMAVVHAPVGVPRHRVSFRAEVREIPADGLSEAINLMMRLTELGGELDLFHIQVEGVEKARGETTPIEWVKAKPRSVKAWDRGVGKAS